MEYFKCGFIKEYFVQYQIKRGFAFVLDQINFGFAIIVNIGPLLLVWDHWFFFQIMQNNSQVFYES